MNDRQGIYIWFQHMRNIRQLKKLGHLVYVSKSMKYALLYVNKKNLNDIKTTLDNYSFVEKVEYSKRHLLESAIERDYSIEEDEFEEKRIGI